MAFDFECRRCGWQESYHELETEFGDRLSAEELQSETVSDPREKLPGYRTSLVICIDRGGYRSPNPKEERRLRKIEADAESD